MEEKPDHKQQIHSNLNFRGPWEIILSVLLIVLFYRTFLTGIPIGTDNSLIYAPFFSIQLQNGSLPLWHPYPAGGLSLLSNFQAAMLYPLRVPFYFLEDWRSYYPLFTLIHYFVGFAGTSLWVSNYTTSRTSACLGGLFFSLGGHMAGRVLNPTIFYSACWVPWLLFAASGNKQRNYWAFLLSLFMIMSIGSPHSLFYGAVGFAIQIFLNQYGRWNLKYLLSYLVYGVPAILLASPTFFSGLSSVSQTLRTGADTTTNLSDSLTWSEIPSSLLGGTGGALYPEYLDKTCYMGLPAVVLIAVSLLRKDPWTNRGWLAGISITLLGFLFSLGENIGLQYMMPYIPGYNRLAGPCRALMLSSAGLSLLVVLAVDYIVSENRWKVLLGVFCSFTLLGTAGFLLRIQKFASEEAPGAFGWMKAWILAPDAVFPYVYTFLSVAVWSFLGVLVAIILCKKRTSEAAKSLTLACLMIFPLFQFSPRVLPETRSASFFDAPESVSYVQLKSVEAENHPFRVTGFDPLRYHASDFTETHARHYLVPNLSSLYDLEDIQGFDPLIRGSYVKLVERTSGRAGFDDPIRNVQIAKPDETLFRLLGVKYLLGHPGDRHLEQNGFLLSQQGAGKTLGLGNEEELISALHFVTFVDGRVKDYPPGMTVAQVTVEGSEKTVTLPVRLGIETSHAHALNEVIGLDPKLAEVRRHAEWKYRAPLPDGMGYRLDIANYRGIISLPEPMRVRQITWQLMIPVKLQVFTQGYRVAGYEDHPEWELVHASYPPVYEFKRALPRFTLSDLNAEELESIDSPEELLDHLKVPEKTFLKSYTGQQIEASLPADGKSLILHQPFDFARRVFAGNERLECFPVLDGNLTAVKLPEDRASEEDILIAYRAPGWASYTTILGWLVVFVLAMAGFNRGRENKSR